MKVAFTRDGDHLVIDEETAAYFLNMDHQETHAGYHTICRSVFAAAKGDFVGAAGDLTTQGVDVIRQCMLPKVALSFSQRVDATIGKPTPPNTTVPLDAGFRSDLVGLLPDVLSAKVTAQVEAYMGCHFRVVQCQLYRTETGGEPHISFLWHRDMEPMAQVHIMVYLTPSGPDDPGTEFLSLAGTRTMAEKGYAYPQFDERVTSLADALPAGAQVPASMRPELAAGDATIFGAPRILHRGLDGQGGRRDVFLINLLPSLVPWQHDIARFGGHHLFWEGDASDTLQTNPFGLTLEPAPRFTGLPVSEWVIMGEMLPAGFG